MLEDKEMRELELVNEEGELLFTPWVLDERSLMAGYEAAGTDAMKDRFFEWVDKVKAWWKKVDVMNAASMKKLELTVNNQAKQWDSIKNDVAGKEPYKIEVTKTNFLLNSQGLSWYTDQLKKMDSWTDNVYKAVPEFRKAVVAALSAARDASDVSGVQSAMGTLNTALSTYYTAVGNNIPEMAPITVNTGENKVSIQKKGQDAINQAIGKYYFADKTTASLGAEWCGSAISAIQPFPTVGKKIFDRVKSSIADWDREIGNAKNQIKGVLDKYSDQKQKQAAAKAMSTFMKSVKEGMKVDQQINSLMGKNLSSAHATSGVLGKAMNHFSSGGTNKEGQKTEGGEQQQGKEMFDIDAYYADAESPKIAEFIDQAVFGTGLEGYKVGTESLNPFSWIAAFFRWLGRLIFGEEKQVDTTVASIEKSKNISSDLEAIKDQKILATEFVSGKDFRLLFSPGVLTQIGNIMSQVSFDSWYKLFDKQHEVTMKALDSIDKLDATKEPVPNDISEAVAALKPIFIGENSQFMGLLKSAAPFKPQSMGELRDLRKASYILNNVLNAKRLDKVKVDDLKNLLKEIQDIPKKVFKDYIDSCKEWKKKDREYEQFWAKTADERHEFWKNLTPEWRRVFAVLNGIERKISAVFAAFFAARRICRTIISGQLNQISFLYRKKIKPLVEEAAKANKEPGSEMFNPIYPIEEYDGYELRICDEILNLPELTEYQAGQEGFFKWISELWEKFTNWLGSLFGGSTSSDKAEKTAEDTKKKATEFLKDTKVDANNATAGSDMKAGAKFMMFFQKPMTAKNYPKLFTRAFTVGTDFKTFTECTTAVAKAWDVASTDINKIFDLNQIRQQLKDVKNGEPSLAIKETMQRLSNETSLGNGKTTGGYLIGKIAQAFLNNAMPIVVGKQNPTFDELTRATTRANLLNILVPENGKDTKWSRTTSLNDIQAWNFVNWYKDIDTSKIPEIFAPLKSVQSKFNSAKDQVLAFMKEFDEANHTGASWNHVRHFLTPACNNVLKIYALLAKLGRLITQVFQSVLQAQKRFMDNLFKLINDEQTKKAKRATESFSATILDFESSYDMLSDEAFEYIQERLDDDLLYIQTADYLQVGQEGFWSTIADWIGKILDAIASLFGGGGSGGGSSSSSSSSSAEKTAENLNQTAQAAEETVNAEQQAEKAEEVINETVNNASTQNENPKQENTDQPNPQQQDNSAKKAQLEEARNFLQQKIWPLLKVQDRQVELPQKFAEAITFDKAFGREDEDKILSYLNMVINSSFTSTLKNDVVEAIQETIDGGTEQREKGLDDLGDPRWSAHIENISREVLAMGEKYLSNLDLVKVRPNGAILLVNSDTRKPKQALRGNFKKITDMLSAYAGYYKKTASVDGHLVKECERWAKYQKAPLAKIRTELKKFDAVYTDKTNTRAVSVRKWIMRIIRTDSILCMNVLKFARLAQRGERNAKMLIRAWRGIYRSLLRQVKQEVEQAVQGFTGSPEALNLITQALDARIKAEKKKSAFFAAVVAMLRRAARQKEGTEAFGERDPFWFLDAPHISDEKAIEMFEQLISEETEDKIQKQVENLDENNEEGYNPDADADMAVEIAGLENQLKVFAYGELKAGQEGFFDAAMRLLTSLADMVSRLFSTFKLVYRSFQGLKRTEYQSYKEKYAATLLRVKRQSFSDIAGISVPHPKGLQVKYIDVLEKLIATLQACDMPARSKGFAVTAKNLRNQLEDGISTEGTVGALFMQAGEVERIRKLWEDSEKCFKGSGNTAEFKTLYSSMEEFNRVLDRTNDAAHYEYDVSKVYSNLNDCNDYLQSAVKYAKTRKAGDGMPISKAELVSLSEACLFMAKTFDVYGLTIQLENRVQHNVVEDIKTIVRSKKL